MSTNLSRRLAHVRRPGRDDPAGGGARRCA